VARALKDALPARSYAALVYAGASVVLAGILAGAPSAFAAPAWKRTSGEQINISPRMLQGDGKDAEWPSSNLQAATEHVGILVVFRRRRPTTRSSATSRTRVMHH